MEIMNLLQEFSHKQKQTLILITHNENIPLQADRMP